MTDAVAIHKTPSISDEVKTIRDRIMRRAYEIFEQSGSVFGRDLDNWFQAEQELHWKPAIELRETDTEFVFEAALPGVEPKDIEIEVTPEDIVLKIDRTSTQGRERNGPHLRIPDRNAVPLDSPANANQSRQSQSGIQEWPVASDSRHRQRSHHAEDQTASGLIQSGGW